jgi:hypothetical protein
VWNELIEEEYEAGRQVVIRQCIIIDTNARHCSAVQSVAREETDHDKSGEMI